LPTIDNNLSFDFKLRLIHPGGMTLSGLCQKGGLMADSTLPADLRKYFSEIGRKGGLKSGEKKGAAGWTPEKRAELGRKGALARAAKKKSLTA
jgi:general stress protein YciG